jgi:hypothetical protein
LLPLTLQVRASGEHAARLQRYVLPLGRHAVGLVARVGIAAHAQRVIDACRLLQLLPSAGLSNTILTMRG